MSWSADDQNRARREGWALRQHPPAIVRESQMFYRSHAAGRRFESDEEAFDHVLAWAASGSAFHMRAIVMVMREQFK